MYGNNINTVFVGIVVYKRTYSVTAVSGNTVIKHASMPADKKSKKSLINREN